MATGTHTHKSGNDTKHETTSDKEPPKTGNGQSSNDLLNKRDGHQDGNAGQTANGPAGRSINDPSAMSCRTQAVEFALALHRGKDKPAVEIVREASIIARYIHEGDVSPVPDAVPVAPAGVMVPPG